MWVELGLERGDWKAKSGETGLGVSMAVVPETDVSKVRVGVSGSRKAAVERRPGETGCASAAP